MPHFSALQSRCPLLPLYPTPALSCYAPVPHPCPCASLQVKAAPACPPPPPAAPPPPQVKGCLNRDEMVAATSGSYLQRVHVVVGTPECVAQVANEPGR